MNSAEMSAAPTAEMYVIKRDGRREPVAFDKVMDRIRKAAAGLSGVNATRLAQLTLAEIHDGVRTAELDELAARLAVSFMTVHPDWATLAARIIVSNCQKNSPPTFTAAVEEMAVLKDARGVLSPALSENVLEFIRRNGAPLNALIQPSRDFLLDYFGFKTLERGYLMRGGAERRIVETPQYLWLRVAVGIWARQPEKDAESLAHIQETYDLMSTKQFTHATPTLFNSGTPRPQMSSCYLLAMRDDSLEGIYDTLKDCAMISKYAGGIGIHIHNIRAQGTYIAGTQGVSNGLVPMLRVFNNTARYVDQCFVPGTLIYTSDGIKPIEEIGVGDRVLTSESNFELVNRPLRHHYDGPVLKMSIKHSIDAVVVTPEHHILSLRNQPIGINHNTIINRLNKHLAEMEWVDAKQLCVGDYLAYKIPSYENDVPSLSEADCRLFGILLGDGHISASTSGVSMNTVTKADGIQFIKEYFTHRGINLYINEQDTLTTIKWSTASTDFKFTYAQLYDSNKMKSMPSYMLHLPKHKILQLLRGIIETDGCIGSKEITIELTSRPLIEQIRYLVLRLGGLTSGYYRDRVGAVSTYRNIVTKLPTWCMRIPRLPEIAELFPEAPHSEYYTFLRHNNYLYSRIDELTEETYSGTVHDFEVDGPHDYTVAHSGIAHNGGGKRNGSIAVYLEPWHADVQAFLKMKSNTGSEEDRARDLFYALWVPDLFMRRVEAGANWSLFCPHEAPGLSDVVGADFDALYERYEAEGKARRVVPAQKLWSEILVSQIETGTPYLVYKDPSNAKSNQKNLGVIKSSNLCVAPETEITIYDNDDIREAIPRVVQIQDVEGSEVLVWNGTELSPVTIRRTGKSQDLIQVVVELEYVSAQGSVSRYATLDCTPYHKFIIHREMASLATAPRIEARYLYPGIELAAWHTPQGELVLQRVVSVMELGRVDDTFCYNEPLNHAGLFNGILTGNCTEILEYSSPEETAVCNLASIALPAFVHPVCACIPTSDGQRQHSIRCPFFNGDFVNGVNPALPPWLERFDFKKLQQVTGRVTMNLNRVIDVNFYPTPETRRSNMRHRPIGIGVQGLADVFAMLGITWESPEAALLNRHIFEHMYYAATAMSNALAKEEGLYETFIGSPASEGQLQPDLWNLPDSAYVTADTLDWSALKAEVQRSGLRNSLLLTVMPTASTSQILGYNECIEPFTSNIYARRTLAGEFTVVNRHLVADLMEAGLWSPGLKDRIIAANGSVQGLDEVPRVLKDRYKTVWEIKQKALIDMAADRGAFICQSQSLNLFVQEPTIAKLSSMHFYAWKRGLKTGIYYLRTKSAVQAIKFTVDPTLVKAVQGDGKLKEGKEPTEPNECLMCSA